MEGAELQPDDLVVEIGAGNGGLTALLAEKAEKVYALEIDPGLVSILQTRFAGKETIEIVSGDALAFDYPALHRLRGRPLKVVANLPYEISTPILFRFFEERACFSRLVLMLQKEVAARLAARPGSKDYGPLSLWTRLYTNALVLFPVSPQAFHPVPKVASAVVRFDFLPRPRFAGGDSETLGKVIRAAFTYRRKTLINALRLGNFSAVPPENIEKALQGARIDPRARGESLSLEEFHRAAEALSSLS